MVHVLMANGDIYTMGPVLPLHAEMPLRYLQGLKAYSDNRLRRVREESGNEDAEESAARIGRATLHAQWVESLVKQVQRGHEYRRRREEDEFATPSRRTSSLSERYPRRAWEVNANLQRPPLADGMVRLHPPHLSETGGPAPGVHRAVVRQGPRVFSPRPQDIGIGSEEDGQIANDLWISHVELRPEENRDLDGGEGVTLVAIAWSGGRVDLGIETEKPEPRWLSSRVSCWYSFSLTDISRKDQSSSSPTLSIIESILLRLPAQDPSDVAANAPTFAMDPLHSDVIYVQHSFGIDAICINPWVDDMAGDEDLPPSEVTRLVESAG